MEQGAFATGFQPGVLRELSGLDVFWLNTRSGESSILSKLIIILKRIAASYPRIRKSP